MFSVIIRNPKFCKPFYNIEMQTTENRNLPKRTEYYQPFGETASLYRSEGISDRYGLAVFVRKIWKEKLKWVC